MMTPAQLERATQAYRKGYYDRHARLPSTPLCVSGVWAYTDYLAGYAAAEAEYGARK